MKHTDWRNDPPSQHLLDQRADVRQRRLVVEGRQIPCSNDSIKLGLSFLLDVWECEHREHEPAKRSNGGIGAGGINRSRGIADDLLLLGQFSAKSRAMGWIEALDTVAGE